MQLDRQLCVLGAGMCHSLIVSVPWGGDLEDRNHKWMEDDILGGEADPEAAR
jgi:hypothetical protein